MKKDLKELIAESYRARMERVESSVPVEITIEIGDGVDVDAFLSGANAPAMGEAIARRNKP